jgi:hypothetical protein
MNLVMASRMVKHSTELEMRTMAAVGTWPPKGRPDVRTAPPGGQRSGARGDRGETFMPLRIAWIIADLNRAADPA